MKFFILFLSIFFLTSCNKDIGIIGGADGPTSIFITEKYEDLEKAPNMMELESSNKTIIGYIKKFQDDMVLFDEIEWVTVPSARATELDITDAPNGFYIHNAESVITEYDIADNCMISILDWEDNFVTKQIELVNFSDILQQRNNTLIPYILTIEDGNVINIEEHYIP